MQDLSDDDSYDDMTPGSHDKFSTKKERKNRAMIHNQFEKIKESAKTMK